MVNLYEILGINPLSDINEIQKAMQKKAQSQSLDIEQLTKIRNTLMNEANRAHYDNSLFTKFPEILTQAQQERVQKAENANKPSQKQSGGGFGLGKLIDSASQSAGFE